MRSRWRGWHAWRKAWGANRPHLPKHERYLGSTEPEESDALNIAMQHSRPDQTNTGKRRLRRITVADKTFFQLCPQFSIEEPRIIAWGSGATLVIDWIKERET